MGQITATSKVTSKATNNIYEVRWDESGLKYFVEGVRISNKLVHLQYWYDGREISYEEAYNMLKPINKRYFIVFYGGSRIDGFLTFITDGTYINWRNAKKTIAQIQNIHEQFFRITNIVELSERDFNDFDKNIT